MSDNGWTQGWLSGRWGMEGHRDGYPDVWGWRDTGMAIWTLGDGGTQGWPSGRQGEAA